MMPVKHLEELWTHSRWSNRNEAIIIVSITIINSFQIQCSQRKALPTLMHVAAAPILADLLMATVVIHGTCNACQMQR